MRTGWVDHSTVAPPPATGLVGHSNGAGLAARLAVEGNVRAYASLSGHVARQVREGITVPKLFTWGFPAATTDESLVAIEDDAWAEVGTPKHRVVSAQLSHWDYLPTGRVPCAQGRGACPLAGVVMWDLVTTFFGRYLPPPTVPGLPSRIPVSLIPPPLDLTDDQRPFAGGWLSGVDRVRDSGDGCAIAISFDTAASSGTVLLPDPEPAPETGGALDIRPDPVNFGSVAMGTTAARTLIIVNQTGAPVTVTFPLSPLGPFSWSAFSGSIADGAQRSFELRFTPASNAIARATLTVTSTDAGSPYSMGLIGKGTGGF
jgi:hypothetical protein